MVKIYGLQVSNDSENGAAAAVKLWRNQGDRQRTNASPQASIPDGPADSAPETRTLMVL